MAPKVIGILGGMGSESTFDMADILKVHLIEERAKYTSQELLQLRKVGRTAAVPTVGSGLWFGESGVEALSCGS
ncbi:MAG: hypothetical protein DRI39_10165 [Chloroflexi bacterium]|nr:MAG: hypothetical protein DRI39_10165 [Chloroflexota bacterium]